MTTCTYCKREFPSVYYETELSRQVTFGLAYEDDYKESEQAELCLDCGREIEDFTDNQTQTEMSAYPFNPDFSIDSASGCSVCDDKIGKSYGHLSIMGGPKTEPAEYVFCESCYRVVSNFLDNIPEHHYSGEKYFCPADLGWRAHVYLHNLTIQELCHADLLRAQRALENTHHRSEQVHRHMFQDIISEVANELGRGATAPVSFNIGREGVPIKSSIELMHNASIQKAQPTDIGNLSRGTTTSVIVPIPPATPSNIHRFTKRIEPQIKEIRNAIGREYDSAIIRTESVLTDLVKHEPDEMDAINQYEIPDKIQELSERVSEDPRSWV